MQIVSSQRAASPLCFPPTASHPIFSAELSSPRKLTHLASSIFSSSCFGHDFDDRFSGLRLGVENISWKRPALASSGLLRHDSQISSSRFNVYAVEKEGEEQEEKDDREEVKVKIPVGPIRNCLDETYTFKRVLGPSSVFVVVTLRKPLGIIFEAVRRRNKERVVVAELVPGSNAQRAFRVNQMFQRTENNRNTRGGSVILNGDVRPGDVLRASTTVGVVVDLFGIRAPRRVVMLHTADGRCWDDTMAALKASFVADGPLTLVLEREI